MTKGDADEIFKDVKVFKMKTDPESQRRFREIEAEFDARLKTAYEERRAKELKAYRKFMKDGPWFFGDSDSSMVYV